MERVPETFCVPDCIRENALISVSIFCDIAVQLVSAVSDLHEYGIIHQGLTTGGIAIDPETGRA